MCGRLNENGERREMGNGETADRQSYKELEVPNTRDREREGMGGGGGGGGFRRTD